MEKIKQHIKNNQTPKKNKLQEKTTKKRKKVKFNSSFVTFAKEDSISHFNDQIITNSGREKDKVTVEIIPPSKKPKLLIKTKQGFCPFDIIITNYAH